MCLWAPDAPESPAKDLGFADTQKPACAICPSHSACLANLLLLQVTTSSLEYQISTDQLVRLQNNPGNCFIPLSRYSWAAPEALPPCLLPSSFCPVPWCHLAQCSAGCSDGVIRPLAINPTGRGSPWLFPAFPSSQLSVITQQITAACDFPTSQPCVRSLLPSALSSWPLPAQCPGPAGTAPWEDGWVMQKMVKKELFSLFALPSLYHWQCTEFQA